MITDMAKFAPHYHVKPPYEHQRLFFEQTRELEYYALFWEMGTGKTKVLIDTAAWLFLQGKIDGVLVVADKGVYMNWEKIEIPVHMPPHIPKRIASYSASMNVKQAAICEALCSPKDNLLDIACINIDAIATDRGFSWAERFIKSHYTLMIVDESTSIKNPKAARTRAAHALGGLADYRRIATGTPITQNPLDLYGQCEFLKFGVLGFKSFVVFKSYYAVIEQMIFGTRRFPKIKSFRYLDQLTAKIAPFSSRILKQDCLDLPDKVYETHFVELSPQQKRLYAQIATEALAQLDNQTLTFSSALTIVEKLHQVVCGHIKDDFGNTIDLENNRVTELLNLVDLIPGKIIVWATYQRDVQLIMSALAKHFRGTDLFAVDYYGLTHQDVRLKNLELFHSNPDCKVFVGTAAVGGKGLTMVQASYMIYYSNNYRLELRLQSEDRIHRIGQKADKVTYIDLVAPETVDAKITKALKKKKDLMSSVIDHESLRSLVLGGDDELI